MKPALAALLSKINANDEKKSNAGHSNSNGPMFPFWTMEENQKAVVRVLPYKNMPDDATSPFIDKLEHVLSINGDNEKIPCIKMFGEDCPICALSAKFYKEEGKTSVKGKYFWRDKKSLASVYVVKDPRPVDETTKENDQGKLKLAQFGNQLASKYEKRLKALLTDEEIDDLPWDLENGLDFQIIKEMQGTYAVYDSSSDFVRKSSSLPADFLETFEPVDLTQYLPANPGLDKVQRMLDAHLTGGEFEDTDTETKSDKPEVEDAPAVTKKTTPKVAKAPVVEQEEVEQEEEVAPVVAKVVKKTEAKAVVADPEPESSDDEDEDSDFLAKLKRRAKEKAE